MNKSLERIANDIIGYSDGSYHVEWGEEYEKLSSEDQLKVQELVWAEIDSCSDCGWHFMVDSMEYNEDAGELLCFTCASNREANNIDEEDEE